MPELRSTGDARRREAVASDRLTESGKDVMTGRALALAAALVIALSGCAALEEPTPNVPSPSPLPALDGTDLDACWDASCEVEVREDDQIGLDAKWGVKVIEVQYLSEEKMTLWLKGLTRDVRLSGLDVDSTHLTVTERHQGGIDNIEISMHAAQPHRAILLLRPA